jgi:L-galactose dehydrogenase
MVAEATAGARQYTTFGRTGLRVSILGLGGAALGNCYGPVEERNALRTVQAAVDAGINFIDTAPRYGDGLSEMRIGRVLAASRRRDQVILATKVGYVPPGLGYDRATTVTAVEASLVRLQTDVIDLIQIHEIDQVPLAQVVGETLVGLQRLQQAGKVRFFGITGENLHRLAQAADTGIFDAVQTYRHYMLTDHAAARRLLPVAARHRLGVINGAPLGMGLLAGAGPRLWQLPPSGAVTAEVQQLRTLAGRFGLTLPALALRLPTGSVQWGRQQRFGLTLPALALRFSLSHPGISVTIPGAGNPAEVAANVAAWEAGPLPADALAAIARIRRAFVLPVMASRLAGAMTRQARSLASHFQRSRRN